MNIHKASEELSKLDIQFSIDNFSINMLWLRVMIKEGKWEIPRHAHSSFEFHFVPEGDSLVILDNNQFIVREGEFYITGPGIYHEQRSAGNRYVEYSMNCDLIKTKDGTFSEIDIIFEILDSAKCIPVKDGYGAMRYFELALQEAYEQKIGFYTNIKNLITMILVMSARALLSEGSFNGKISLFPVPKKLKDVDYRFTLIKKFIEDNISDVHRVEDIVNYLHLSSKQINRIVKEVTNKSTKELINSIKLKKAKEMLKDTNLPIKEIANKLGFSSEYYFNQFFKREEGYPPGHYRNNIKKYY